MFVAPAAPVAKPREPADRLADSKGLSRTGVARYPAL